MTGHFPALAVAVVAACCTLSAPAQDSTPPATAADLEVVYTTAIEKRTDEILALLALSDAARSTRVRDTLLTQYRALKARDEMIDRILNAHGKILPPTTAERASLFQCLSAPLHARFLAKLSTDLSSDQVEKVKDKMTYNKVKVTFDAYCAIVRGLTDTDKAKVLELLKSAREEAIDGGSAKEKSDIFQKYKDQINDYLASRGYDVAKAYREWNARQEEAKAASAASTQQPAR